MALNRTEKYRERLITLLEELFQLNQPDLDFGLVIDCLNSLRFSLIH